MKTETVWLQRPSGDVPWGFRLSGGVDQGTPLTVYRVSPGSIASTGVAVGDVILRVGEAETSSLTHNQCQNHLQAAGNLLQLHIAKGGSASPSITSPQPDQYATRLNQQLAAGMDSYPTSPGHFSDVQPDYNNYNNYNNADNNDYNNMADNGYSSAPKAPPLPSPTAAYRSQPTPPPPAMPDKVLNMAAKGGPGKTPFSYVPDADMLKEHRDRVRRRGRNLPHYQNMLNMPNFDDSRVPYNASPSPSNVYRPASAQANYHSPSTPDNAVFNAGPGGATVAHAQYNSPLSMYSNDNVADAFAGQTDGLVTGVRTQGGGKPSGPDITQSATYKMIHGLDEPPPTTPTQGRRPVEGQRPVRQPSQDDELSFSGVGRDSAYDHIPSRAFHKLQSLTGGSEVDRSSIRGNVSGDDDEVGNYNEASIRYRGGSIPSRSFRMLQSMTGSDDSTPPVSAKPTRRNLRRAESAPHYQEDDDRDGGVDLSYVGASIPSRSFRMLQQSIGADPSDYDAGVTNGMQDPLMVGPSDGSQPTPEAQARAARERRRRRRRGSLPRQVSSSPIRRPVLPREQPHEAQPSDFDEDAYLAGRVPIVRSEDEIQARPLARKTIEEAAVEDEVNRKRKEEIETRSREDQENFDERAWLRGQAPVWGGNTDAIKVTRSRSHRAAEPDDEIPPENLRDFDERAFLAGQVSMLGGDPDSCNLPPRVPKKKEFSVRPDWAHTVHKKKKERAFERSTSQVANERLRAQEKASMQYITLEDQPQRDFDEKAYLHGQVPIFDDQPKAPRPMMKDTPTSKQPYEFQKIAQRRASIDFQDPLKRAMEEAERLRGSMIEAAQEDNRNDQEPFDERAFLQGRMPGLVSGEENPNPILVPDKVIPKEIPAWVKKAPQADPDCFEERAYLGGRIPLIGEGTQAMRPVSRPRKKKPKPEPEPEDDNREPFDERAFLAGQIPILGGAVDPNAPPRQPKKVLQKEFAPWERQDTSEDHPDENAGEFDERQFLQGRVPVVRSSAERDARMPRQVPFSPKLRNRQPRAPWERFRMDHDNEEEDSEFDERNYLAGRVAIVRQSAERDLGPISKITAENDSNNANQRIPSKTFIRLSRSVSKDGLGDNPDFAPTSPKTPTLKVLRKGNKKPSFDRSRSLSPGEARRRQMELQLGTTKDVPLEDMKYKGTSIPSKSFARLQSQVSRSGGDEPTPDPLERLRNKQPDGFIDPEKALEVMQIREHSPEKFFDALENVATGGSGKPQVNGDVKAPEPPKQVKAAEPPKQVKATEPPKQVKPQTPSTGGIKVISRSISQDAKQQQPPPMQQPAQQQQQPQQQQQQQKQQPQQQQQQPPPPPPPQQQQVDQANFDEADDQVTDF